MGGAISRGGAKISVIGEEAEKIGNKSDSVVLKLKDNQLDEFRECFNAFDEDGGGSIDKNELKELMLSVGQNPTDDDLAEMIRIADADGTGDIDFAEFVTLMAHHMSGSEDTVESLTEAFKVFDASGDGSISPGELKQLLINVGEPVNDDDVDSIIKEVDVDGDGEVSFDEFARLILSNQKKR